MLLDVAGCGMLFVTEFRGDTERRRASKLVADSVTPWTSRKLAFHGVSQLMAAYSLLLLAQHKFVSD